MYHAGIFFARYLISIIDVASMHQWKWLMVGSSQECARMTFWSLLLVWMQVWGATRHCVRYGSSPECANDHSCIILVWIQVSNGRWLPMNIELAMRGSMECWLEIYRYFGLCSSQECANLAYRARRAFIMFYKGSKVGSSVDCSFYLFEYNVVYLHSNLFFT